jgi:drug/metabolite transporter (DMT)-like permease
MPAERRRDRPWRSPDAVLLGVNVVYASSYVATRLTLGDVPPATLALVRCALGAVLLLPLALRRPLAAPVPAPDRWRIAAMGVLGFGAAFAFAHWGLLRSTAANAALLIIVEPIAIIALSPLLLREQLRRREVVGATLALVGTMLVVLDGIPGLTARLAPHWRGDLLLMASGLAYASYSLIGRDVLRRHPATPVTAISIAWGAVALVPLAGLEWWAGERPRWTAQAVAGTLYLTVVITALAYMVWNWALERVPAPRAAIFLNVQPVAGSLLGVLILGDAFTAFTAAGGALIVAGLSLTTRGA